MKTGRSRKSPERVELMRYACVGTVQNMPIFSNVSHISPRESEPANRARLKSCELG